MSSTVFHSKIDNDYYDFKVCLNRELLTFYFSLLMHVQLRGNIESGRVVLFVHHLLVADLGFTLSLKGSYYAYITVLYYSVINIKQIFYHTITLFSCVSQNANELQLPASFQSGWSHNSLFLSHSRSNKQNISLCFKALSV